MSLATTLTRPDKILIACAIPFTRDQFFKDLHPGSIRDFAKHIDRVSNYEGEDLWNYYYDSTLSKVENVLSEAEQKGVTVLRSVSRGDLAHIFDAHDVVVFLTHFKGASFIPDDFHDPERFASRLAEVQDPVCRKIRAGIVTSRLTQLKAKAARTKFADELTKLCAREAIFLEIEPHLPEQNFTDNLLYLNRIALERHFVGELRPGGVVDLSDGACAPLEFAQNLPVAKPGILDLTICESYILGQAIKGHHPGTLVLVNEKPATIVYRMIFFKHLLDELSKRGANYALRHLEMRKELTRRINLEKSGFFASRILKWIGNCWRRWTTKVSK